MDVNKWNAHKSSRIGDLKVLYRYEEYNTEDLIPILRDYFGYCDDISNCPTIEIWNMLDGCRAAYGLCFEIKYDEVQDEMYLSYLLSWGGPSEELRFYLTRKSALKRITFVYQDWSEFYEGTLDEDEFTTATAIFDFCRDCGILVREFKTFIKRQE